MDNSVTMSSLNKVSLSIGSAQTNLTSNGPICQVVYAKCGDAVTAVLAENPLNVNKMTNQQVSYIKIWSKNSNIGCH